MNFINALLAKLTDITDIKYMLFLSLSSSLLEDMHS